VRRWLFIFMLLCTAIFAETTASNIQLNDRESLISFFDTCSVKSALDLLSSLDKCTKKLEILYGVSLNNFTCKKGRKILAKFDFDDRESCYLLSAMNAVSSESINEVDYPTSFIIGGIELMVGTLIYILPVPLAKHVGAAVIADGSRRVFNGIEDLSDLQKEALLDFSYVTE
jgi:hypothetical protein